jgi:hypothetical protein
VSDARTGKRFPLELPIKIHKGEASGESSGVTGNLSAAGVYIRADAALEVGGIVRRTMHAFCVVSFSYSLNSALPHLGC